MTRHVVKVTRTTRLRKLIVMRRVRIRSVTAGPVRLRLCVCLLQHSAGPAAGGCSSPSPGRSRHSAARTLPNQLVHARHEWVVLLLLILPREWRLLLHPRRGEQWCVLLQRQRWQQLYLFSWQLILS